MNTPPTVKAVFTCGFLLLVAGYMLAEYYARRVPPMDAELIGVLDKLRTLVPDDQEIVMDLVKVYRKPAIHRSKNARRRRSRYGIRISKSSPASTKRLVIT